MRKQNDLLRGQVELLQAQNNGLKKYIEDNSSFTLLGQSITPAKGIFPFGEGAKLFAQRGDTLSKCRLIDMEAYCRGEIRIIGEHGNTQAHHLHSDLCPECGQFSVFPEGGCWSCKSCGWSKCNTRR